MALRYWPDEDPIGKKFSFRSYGGDFTVEIVGMVGDTHTTGLEIEPKPEFYVSYASSIGYSNTMSYIVRTAADPLTLLPAVKAKIREVSSDAAFYGVSTIDQLVARSLDPRRFNLLLLASFAIVALILAGVGLYGLISFMTAQRTYEISIRMAFGANQGDVLKLIIGQGMALTLAGVVIGLLASLALTRLMQKLLFGISPTDPMTFVVIALVLCAVPLLACYIPARRATKVDPMVALHYE
jgi:ABC-type antimicrobial peptide transport system permease subunit